MARVPHAPPGVPQGPALSVTIWGYSAHMQNVITEAGIIHSFPLMICVVGGHPTHTKSAIMFKNDLCPRKRLYNKLINLGYDNLRAESIRDRLLPPPPLTQADLNAATIGLAKLLHLGRPARRPRHG